MINDYYLILVKLFIKGYIYIKEKTKMPSLLRNINRGYYKENGIKKESGAMMAIIESNLKKKNSELEKDDKVMVMDGGVVRRQLKKFNKTIKSKNDI